MTAELHQFPSKSPEPEAERVSAIVAAFDALPDALRVTVLATLSERLGPSYGRAAAAMLSNLYPTNLELE